MLKVFVCEDDIFLRKKITKYVKGIIETKKFNMKVVLSTESPNDIINYLIENTTVGLYFLDVDLNTDIDGIELAVEIRKYDPRGFIVFVTKQLGLIPVIFEHKIEALDYIIKDNYNKVCEEIHECIINANKRYGFDE